MLMTSPTLTPTPVLLWYAGHLLDICEMCGVCVTRLVRYATKVRNLSCTYKVFKIRCSVVYMCKVSSLLAAGARCTART